MQRNKTKWVIGTLILLIVILVGVVSYAYVLKPAVSGYTISAQSQGVEFAVISIMQQASNCQQVPLTFGNQTMNIIAVGCLPPELFQQPPIEL
tara:strand:- start:171 stop:449 length:279 start_codon:yes stop_codon:yes gene_type:complete